MEEVYQFLRKCKYYFLATCEGNQPHVRPFGTVNIFEGNLYIQTGHVKSVSHQIEENPKCEICAYDAADNTWVRVAATLVEDARLEAKASMLDSYPELRAMYNEHDGNTVVYKLTDATATFSSFTTPPRVVRFGFKEAGEGQINCQECGAVCDKHDVFCPNCGNKLDKRQM